MSKNLFLFTGGETYLLNSLINNWKDAFIKKHGDMNLDVLDAQEKPLNEIMASATAMPFLGDKRLIFIHNLPDPPKTRNVNKETKKDEKRNEELEKLEKSLDSIPESSIVVFVQSNPDKRKSFYKKLVKRTELKEFQPLQGKVLITWLQNEVKKKGGTIDYDTAEYLASLTGQDLWRLAQEAAKLTSYTPNQAITRAAIDLLVVPTLEANIFHFTDALGAKNHKKAIRKLHQTMAAGDNLRPVFYMIVRQFRLLLQASGYMSSNANANSTSFAAALKLHPFVAKNTLGQLKHFNQKELKKAYEKLLDIDTALKTSKIRITVDDQDELALAIERFIMGFCCE